MKKIYTIKKEKTKKIKIKPEALENLDEEINSLLAKEKALKYKKPKKPPVGKSLWNWIMGNKDKPKIVVHRKMGLGGLVAQGFLSQRTLERIEETDPETRQEIYKLISEN